MSPAQDPSARRLERASLLNDQALRLYAQGRFSEGLVCSEEAVALLREFVAADSGLSAKVAMALHNQATGLSEVGRPDDALQAAREAVAMCRKLAIKPALAITLNQLAVLLIEGAPDEAARIAKKAVRISRRLVRLSADHKLSVDGRAKIAADALHDDPDEIVLARALNTLGLSQFHLGRHPQQLAAIEEAVGIYRRFNHANQRWEPRLAEVLDNLGVALQTVGHPGEALHAGEESVRRYKDLSIKTPSHLPGLAGALHNLSRHLYLAVRHREAVAAGTEAVQYYRGLARAEPARYVAELERATHTLSALQNGASPFR